MRKIRISKQELEELRKRQSLIKNQVMIFQALELQKRVWLTDVIKKLGFKDDKVYDVNYRTGEITETKEPKQ